MRSADTYRDRCPHNPGCASEAECVELERSAARQIDLAVLGLGRSDRTPAPSDREAWVAHARAIVTDLTLLWASEVRDSEVREVAMRAAGVMHSLAATLELAHGARLSVVVESLSTIRRAR